MITEEKSVKMVATAEEPVELYDRQIAKDAEPYWEEKKLRICITGSLKVSY